MNRLVSIKNFLLMFFSKVKNIVISQVLKSVTYPKRYAGYAIFLLTLFFIIFSNYGIITRVRLEYKNRNIEDEIKEMKKREKVLDSLIDRAMKLEEIERVAREKYNFSLEGEIIYKVAE